MFTSQNNKMVEALSGPEQHRTPQERIAIIQQTMEPGMTVSHIARLHSMQYKPDIQIAQAI
ncbi:IS2 repressor TnpA [Escherichia coli]|nr:tyrosine recombinase [Escherichia coli]RDP45317.1 IS2 repressor TnpA [Escherichia coli]